MAKDSSRFREHDNPPRPPPPPQKKYKRQEAMKDYFPTQENEISSILFIKTLMRFLKE